VEAILAAFDRDGGWLLAAAVCVRMAAAVTVGTLPILPGASLRIRAILALVLAGAALPAALAVRGDAPGDTPAASPPAALLLCGEAIVGLALGAAVGGVVAAAGWAGGVLGTAAGLSWADDFDPASAGPPGGVARLCFFVGLAAFFAAGGQLAVVAGLVDGVRTVPVGAAATGAAGAWLETLACATPAAACELAVLLALPALAAVLAFHVTAAICLRTIPFAPGPGLLVSLSAVVLLATLALSAEAWAGGAATLAGDTARRLLGGH
jgi:flagellar biosynthesis protein FliR